MLIHEGICSTHGRSLPIRLSITRAGAQNSMALADNTCFRQFAFFVPTIDTEAVTMFKFAIQTVKVCVYTPAKFDLCSSFASIRTSGRFLMVTDNRWLTLLQHDACSE